MDDLNSEEQSEEEQEEALQTAAPIESDTSAQFIQTLPEVLSKEELQLSCRATEDGLFIDETLAIRVVEAYQKWLKEITQSSSVKSFDKCKKRLFESENPAPAYIVEGKQSKIGFVIPRAVDNPHKLGITAYRGKSLDALSYLHPRDPIFDKLNRTQMQIDNSGIQIIVETKRNNFRISMKVFEDLVKITHPPKRRDNDVFKAAWALRDRVPKLSSLIIKARFVRRNDILLIPIKEKEDERYNYFRIGDLVFVADANNVIIQGYDLSSRRLKYFVYQELRNLANTIKNKRIKGFYLYKNKRNQIGEISKNSERFIISMSSFFVFLDSYYRVRPRIKTIPRQYSISDLLAAYVDLFLGSERILKHLSPEAKAKDILQEYKTGSIYFHVGKNNMINNIIIPQRRKTPKHKPD